MSARILSALKHVRRLPECVRCAGEFSNPAPILTGYLGLGAPKYPLELRLRAGGKLRITHFDDLVTAWLVLCRQEYQPPADARVILDLGANYGAFTLFAAGRCPQSHIISVEPFPATFARLSEHVRTNGLESRVTLVSSAVAGTAGQCLMNAGEVADQNRGLVKADQDVPVVEVGATTLDELVDQQCAALGCTEIDYVKMDVEGAEYEIIPSASLDTLRRLKRLEMEYHDRGPRQPLFRKLEESGLRLVHDDEAWQGGGIARFRRA